MATVYTPNFNTTEEEKAKAANAPSLGGGGASTGTSAPGAAPQQQGQPQTSGQAPNIQKYISANAGGGQQLASGIQANVQKQADQANQNLQASQSQFDTQAKPLENELGNQAQGVIKTSFQDPNSLMNAYNASQQPNAQANPQQQNLVNQYNEFQRLRQGNAVGDINKINASQAPAQANIQNIKNAGKLAGNEAGQFQLLQQSFANPSYSSGQQKLDQLLLQTQPNVTRGLQHNLENLGNQTNQQLNSNNQANSARLDALRNLAQQNQSNIGNMFNQNIGGIESNVKNEYTQAQNNAASVNANLQDALKNNRLTPEQVQSLGLMPNTHTWGVDVANAGQYAANPLVAGANGGYAQVASPEEFARYQALNQLAGNTNDGIFGSASKAGGYTPFNFNTGAFNQAVADKQAAYQKDYQSVLPQLINQLGGVGHTGPGSIAPWDLSNALESANAGGKLTADQANDMINRYAGAVNATGGAGGILNQWTNFYNPYSAAENNILGQSSPETAPLPLNNNGQIDWGSIKAPMGK